MTGASRLLQPFHEGYEGITCPLPGVLFSYSCKGVRHVQDVEERAFTVPLLPCDVQGGPD